MGIGGRWDPEHRRATGACTRGPVDSYVYNQSRVENIATAGRPNELREVGNDLSAEIGVSRRQIPGRT